MRVLIVEDEKPAARRLAQLVRQIRPDAELLDPLDSVETTVAWWRQNPAPDLLFLDIQLADGLSFEIFESVEINAPVIFTTAFDEYALRAFKVNSVDYLLKPIDPEALERALGKFDKTQLKTSGSSQELIQNLLEQLREKNYKKRFLVKNGQQLNYLNVPDIAYFYSDDGLIFAHLRDGKRHHLDYTLDQLVDVLNPQDFFRINRKIITSLDAIRKIHTYFNSRLKLELTPVTELESIVSRDRVNDFKRWLDR